VRNIFPYLVLAMLVGAVAWAVSFSRLPPADFTFINGAELKSIDPAKASDTTSGRIINAISEGLYRQMPKKDKPSEMEPQPALAEGHTLSPDQKTYTFTIRKNAKWTDGSPVTAYDFVWSWKRLLNPETACEYAYQLHYVKNAKQYNTGRVEVGDRVEVEHCNRKRPSQVFPRGTISSGILKKIEKPSKPTLAKDVSKKVREKKLGDWKQRWIYLVEIKDEKEGKILWDQPGKLHRFIKASDVSLAEIAASKKENHTAQSPALEQCQQLLLHFSQVAIHATDARTLVVTLDHQTPYFLDLMAFYPLYPVHRKCVEKYGYPQWTKPNHIVTCGPFRLKFRRIRDRIRLVKNETYWNADQVQLNIIDALAVSSATTSLNMYENGQVDWISSVPNAVIPKLSKRKDFYSAPMLSVYYYRLNVEKEELKNPLVRRALNMAIDKEAICKYVARAGQIPARNFVPPGLPGYQPALCGKYDVQEAKRLLKEAGYPNGKGLPKIQLLYNTQEGHRHIAEVIERQWKAIGIDVELKNVEWQVFLNMMSQKKYTVARAGWVGDYPDPNTFLDMFVTNGDNNQTNWSNKEYDKLIHDATMESDQKKRLEILHHAETILMEEQPIIPIYFSVSVNMTQPYVKNFHTNVQDLHPLHLLRIHKKEKQHGLQSGEVR